MPTVLEIRLLISEKIGLCKLALIQDLITLNSSEN